MGNLNGGRGQSLLENRRLRSVVYRRRYGVQAAADALAWAAALLITTVVRYDFALSSVDPVALAVITGLAALVQLDVGYLLGLYSGRFRYGSFDEVAGLLKAAVIATVLIALLNLWFFESGSYALPRTVPLGSGATALVTMAGIRYGTRLFLERRRRPSLDRAQRLIVFGAGEGGAQVVTAMLRDPDSPYVPIALLDDDPAKRRLRIGGVPVLGSRDSLNSVALRCQADGLLIAIPSASRELISTLSDAAYAAGLHVHVLPPVRELFGAPQVSDIRKLDPADLLGRHEVETDLASIAGYITGKRVLVTGAGGSIGSELCRQLHNFAPAELMMLDRDESAIHAVQLSIEGRALLDSPNLILADIRDGNGLLRLFERRRPQVVFHAAALKHLPLLERHPGEALQTNIWGTLNTLVAAAATGVDRFVNISTDKAADPVSVLGYSKRIAERLTAYMTETAAKGTYLSVRFGNVLGSRGSMLGTFQAQIAAGGPITVTDPEVTRYFMTIQEACQLVIQAGAIGRHGEALVLDMGEPVKIADVARRLAAEAPGVIEIVYTGLREGEKIHEDLLAAGEVDERPIHPLISHVPVPPLEPSEVLEIDALAPADALIGRFRALAETPVATGVPAAD